MTDIVLLEQLKTFVEEQTKDIILPVRPVKNKTTEEYQAENPVVKHRVPEVFLQRLPDKDAETNRIPYILLQVLTGIDDQNSDGDYDSECKVRLVAATYSEDGQAGSMALMNVLTRLRVALLRERQVGQFLLRLPLERVVYPDNVSPYYLGEMLLTFEMPEIQREINFESEENI
ncbi:MAG: hypothetical protein FWF94_08780 [Oscillospiraceae bacterium]|nr:hypothetical protein [Oscillospiraceae bacterium]